MRKGPESVPFTPAFIALVVIVYGVFGVVIFTVSTQSAPIVALINVLLVTGLIQCLVWLLLRFKGYVYRFPAVLVATLGTEVLISVLTLPLVFALRYDSVSVQALAKVVFLVMTVWAVLVKGFIYHRALGVSRVQGHCLSLALLFLSYEMGQGLSKLGALKPMI